ncbi:hypothetical protein SCP_1101800 [Sparassis crispa]|uniref:Uncharacterized protein n=1 Tax=Sparassis crispa TaxID=139825 RepID=A0A401GZB0_9APHY|nr:hypothetical protein SCP_1101800 [Sparassis crispa]GBE87503.1 hypothetical protein SCP_1101800 [Sparassis crispa]
MESVSKWMNAEYRQAGNLESLVESNKDLRVVLRQAKEEKDLRHSMLDDEAIPLRPLRLGASLELVKSVWSDEGHKTLDNSVLRLTKSIPFEAIEEDPEVAALLLHPVLSFVESVSKWMNAEHREVGNLESLVNSNKDQRVALRQAKEEKDFYAFRCLRILRKDRTPTPWDGKSVPKQGVEYA